MAIAGLTFLLIAFAHDSAIGDAALPKCKRFPCGAPTLGRFQASPQFRAGIDLVQVDVSVLDKDRRPVRGLTAADFTVTENGTPQSIAAFAVVDSPAAGPFAAPWGRTASADVATNTLGDRRLFVLYMDDQHVLEPGRIEDVKAIARAAVNQLGPGDLGAIVFPVSQQHSQQFTNDKPRLLAAITKFQPKAFQGPTILDSLRQLTDLLGSVHNRRKVVLYIGPGIRLDPAVIAKAVTPDVALGDAQGVAGQAFFEVQHLIRSAQLANVAIYAADPRGLQAPPGEAKDWSPLPRLNGPEWDPTRLDRDFLMALSRETGGRAIVNDNDPAKRIPMLFVENSSYYLLGFKSTQPSQNGKFRKLIVRVNRPNVEVRARGGYYTPTSAAQVSGLTPVAEALTHLIPKAEVPMRLAASPYWVPGAGSAAAVTVRIEVPSPPEAARETADVLLDVFDLGGNSRGPQRRSVEWQVAPGVKETTAYEALFRVDLPPGRYQVRASATLARTGRTGSVFGDIDVIDFAKAPIALSGVAITQRPGVVASPLDALAELVPAVPVATREFKGTDEVGAFFRIYEGGTLPPNPVALTVEVLDVADAVAQRVDETLAADRFKGRGADCRVAIPVAALRPGMYLLRVRAALDRKRFAQREVPFIVY